MNAKSLFPLVEEIPRSFAYLCPYTCDRYLVNGELIRWDGPFRKVLSPVSVRTSSGLDPYHIGAYPLLGAGEAIRALDAAKDAFREGRGVWPSLTVGERITSFETFTDRLRKKRKEVATLLMWEIGKSYGDSCKEFDRTVAYIHDTIKALKRKHRAVGKHTSRQGIRGFVERVPLGVVLAMGPYNYPLYETFTAIAPAMLTGNTVICKPPRYGALLFAPLMELLRDCFPPGSINVIFGEGKEIIPPLMASGGIDVLAFIGTSEVARRLKDLHPKPHRLRSLLGLEAKNPAIILPDADLQKAARESAMGALAFNGQRCAALKLFFVHTSVVDPFVSALAGEIGQLKCGMPWEDDVFITPLVNEERTVYLAGLVEDAVKKGANMVHCGGIATEGAFVPPVLLYPVNLDMRVYGEEQFGPIIPVVPYNNIDECLRYVGESRYGQQASVFGRDPAKIAPVVAALVHQVSRVNINCKCQRTPDTFPFSGRKDSAEGVLSVIDALEAFTVPAVVAARDTQTDAAILSAITDT